MVSEVFREDFLEEVGERMDDLLLQGVGESVPEIPG
jgi:hypothetical protein